MGQVLHGSATTTEAVRRAIQHSQEPRRWPSASGSIKRPPPSGGSDFGRRSADWAEEAPFIGPVRGGRGRGGRLPKAYPAAAQRLPLRAQPTIPHLTRSVAASLPAASWNLAAATGRRRSFAQAQVQSLPDRIFPYRHRREFEPLRESSISSSRSIGPRSSPSSNCMRR